VGRRFIGRVFVTLMTASPRREALDDTGDIQVLGTPVGKRLDQQKCVTCHVTLVKRGLGRDANAIATNAPSPLPAGEHESPDGDDRLLRHPTPPSGGGPICVVTPKTGPLPALALRPTNRHFACCNLPLFKDVICRSRH
jgi:hypothetical protein